MWTLDGTLAWMKSALPEPLAPEGAYARAAEVAGALPASLTDCVYLERWLGHGPARLDLIVRVGPDGRAHLANAGRAAETWPGPPAAWRRLASFAHAIAPGGPLDGRIEALWLEFDLPGRGARAAPRVFVDFAAPELGDRDRCRALALEVAERLLGHPVPSETGRAVHVCFDGLPERATVPYVGFWPTASPAIRLCVRGLGDALPAFVGTVSGARAAQDLAARVLAPLAGTGVRSSFLHLDAGAEGAPVAGIEYPFARAPQRRGELAERPFLDALVRLGLCGRDERDALLAWPGYSVEVLPHQIWHTGLLRRVSHVKIACAPEQPLRAKAYLAVLLDLVRGGTLVAGRPWRPADEATGPDA